MGFVSQGEFDAQRTTLTRYLQGFIAIRCIWTCNLRGVTAPEGVSPAWEHRPPPPTPFFIGRNASATLTPTPPLLLLGKVAFLAQSAVNSEAFEILSWGPQRKGGWRVPPFNTGYDLTPLRQWLRPLRRDLLATPLPPSPPLG